MIPATASQPTRPLVGTFLSILLALGVLSHVAVGVRAMPVPPHAVANRNFNRYGHEELPYASIQAPQATALPRNAEWAPLPLQARTYNPSSAVSKALNQAGDKGKSSSRCITGGGGNGSGSGTSSSSASSVPSSSSQPAQTTSCPVFATGGFKGAKGESSNIPTTCLAPSSTSTSISHPSSTVTSTSSSASKSWSSSSSHRPTSSKSHSSKGHKTCSRKTSSTGKHSSSKPSSSKTTSATATLTSSLTSASSPSSSSAPATSTSSSSGGSYGSLWPHDGYTKDELRSDLRKIMKWAYDQEQLKGNLFEETVEAVWSASERYWNEMPARVTARIILADIKSESDFDNRLEGDAWGLMQVTPGGDSNELDLFKKHATVNHHKTSWEKGSIPNSKPLTDYKSSEPLDVSKLTNKDLLRPWINIHVASWIQTNLARTGSNDPYDWKEMAQEYRTLIQSNNKGEKTADRKKLDKYLTATGLPYSFETGLGSWLAGPATDGEGSYKQKGDNQSADYLNTVMDAVRMLYGKQSLTSGFLNHWKVHPGLVDYNIWQH